jgi:hypothetical protein
MPLRLTWARSRWARLASTFDLGSTFPKAARSQEFFLGNVINWRDDATGEMVAVRSVAQDSKQGDRKARRSKSKAIDKKPPVEKQATIINT